MKKIIRNLAVFIAVCGTFCNVVKATTVTATISSTTVNKFTPSLLLRPHESLTYTLTGTATGQATIEKSRNNQEFSPAGVSVTGAGVLSSTGKLYSDEQTLYFRIRLSTITAGSFVLTMYDNDDVVQEFKNNKGIPIVVISDDSTAISGGFTASIATVTTLYSSGGTQASPSLTSPSLSGAISVTAGSTITYSATLTSGTITNITTTTFSGASFNGTKTDNSTTTYTGGNTFKSIVSSGTFINNSNSMGWVVRTGADTACTTTCGAGKGCVFGQNTAAVTYVIVACTDATADVCVCSQ